MSANTTTRVAIRREFSTLNVPMYSGTSALYRGNRVGNVPGSWACAPMGTTSKMKALGMVMEDRPGVDNIGGTSYPVPIKLDQKIIVEYLANDSSPIVLATDFMKIAYYKDDHTFTLSSNDGSGNYYKKAGLVVDVNSKEGVGVWLIDVLSMIADSAMIS